MHLKSRQIKRKDKIFIPFFAFAHYKTDKFKKQLDSFYSNKKKEVFNKRKL